MHPTQESPIKREKMRVGGHECALKAKKRAKGTPKEKVLSITTPVECLLVGRGGEKE